jgi:putative SOS response-associated peptidase YedK
MCFHTKQTKSIQELEQRFKAKFVSESDLIRSETINGFSFPKTPVIINQQPDLIQGLNWGLIPFWAKNKDIKSYTLNAKVETLTEKPSFKNSINKRCLVIVDGFYEWKWLDSKGKNKQKYLIEIYNHESFAFGGIWSEWIDESTGEILKTYSIVTTKAKGIMEEIHNAKKRMPIILNPEKEQKWLENADFSEFIELEVSLIAKKV